MVSTDRTLLILSAAAAFNVEGKGYHLAIFRSGMEDKSVPTVSDYLERVGFHLVIEGKR